MPEMLTAHDYRAIDAAYRDFIRRHRETAKMLWGSRDDPHLLVRPKIDDEIL